MAIDHYENFPVASLLLPSQYRDPVALIYRFARTADDFADEGTAAPEVRLAQLAAYEAEVAAIAKGMTPDQPLFRDIARMVREQGWRGAPVIGFSAGAYIAAEMAAAGPDIFSRMVLVGPLGLRTTAGEIFDFLAVTIRTHVAATVSNVDAPEFATIYGGEMTHCHAFMPVAGGHKREFRELSYS